MKAEAQLYSRGAERTDVADVEEEAEMSNRSPAASCRFDSQMLGGKKKKKHYVSHTDKIRLPSSSPSCFTGHFARFNIRFHMLSVRGYDGVFLRGDEARALSW